MSSPHKRLARALAIATVVIAACGSDQAAPVVEPSISEAPATAQSSDEDVDASSGDDELSAEAEDVESALLRAGRADVSVAADLIEEVLTVEVNAIDVDYLDVPSIDVTLDGFTIPTLPDDCTPTDAGISCKMPVGLRAATDGQPPTESAIWTIQLTDTTPDDDSTATVVATSRDNPLDNDPDPTNNTITLTDNG